MARNMNPGQKFNCIFCQEIFDEKEAFQIHFRKHGDPKFIPNKTKIKTEHETRMSSEKSNDEVEMVGCDVCSEVFPTISKAITHKHKMHPDHDAKYFCPWCGKLFTMKHLYNKHLQKNHDNIDRGDERSFHCDGCDVDFWVPAAMMYHNKFFHRQDTDIPAFGHSKKLKMYNQEAIQIYYCSFCGEEFENKVNLHKHTVDDHSDENQSPDDVLRCPLCDAIFYHLDAYELHLTFHSTEDMYSEKNELMNEITEFSLESVPPMMEKVEICEPQQDAETTMNEVGIDRFLEIAMGDSNLEEKKSKKHKKHKKSKKSAITLDEFLNMNTDVFGEGLDFQGIEEVPTQAITKRLKSYKKQGQNSTKSNPELEKLRKQGIVIKKKPGRKPLLQSLNKTIPAKSVVVSKLGTSEEVLSKLLNQSNSQIKIVKKTGQQDKNEQMSRQSDKLEDKEPTSPKTNEMECDTTKKELGMFPEKTDIYNMNESKDKASLEHSDISDRNTSQDSQDTSDSKSECLSPTENSNKYNKISVNSMHNNEDEDTSDKHEESSNCSEDSEKNHAKVASSVQSLNNVKKKDISNPLNTLLNTGHITIKTSNNTETRPDSDVDATDNSHDGHDDIVEASTKNNTEKNINNISNPLNAILNTGHITFKTTSNSTKTTTETRNENDVDATDNNHDEHDDIVDASTKNNTDKKKDATNNSLSAFKHLSHLITIKPVNTSKNNAQIDPEGDRKIYGNASPVNSNVNTKDTEDSTVTSTQVTKESKTGKIITQENEFKLDTLKNLGINITLKSSAQLPKSDGTESEFTGDRKKNENVTEKRVDVPVQNKSSINTSASAGKSSSIISSNSSKAKKSPNLCNRPTVGKRNDDDVIKNEASANILKHLTNITAKPVNTKNVVQLVTSSTQPENTVNKKNCIQEEIFNIDDSDSDEMESNLKNNKLNESQPIGTLKNISKNVTVKPLNQHRKQINKMHNLSLDNVSHDDSQGTQGYGTNNYAYGSCEQASKTTKCLTESVIKEKNAAIKHTLKNLSKNITVQSRNSSPNLSLKAHDQNSQDSKIGHNDDDSDSDSYSGNIKITELDNDNSSDEEIKNSESCGNVMIQSPGSSCSDNEVTNFSEANFNEENEDELDIESQITANTLKKIDNKTTSIKNSTCLNNLKNITVKSLNESSVDKEDKMPKIYTTPEIAKNLGRQISIKPTRQIKKDANNVSNTNVANSSNQSSINKKMSTSCNQTNTVNKEVTVKTFQSQTKTVIQEITTTVTKTIKTVNQTMKQEVRNMSQSNSTSIIQQKAQGMRSNQQSQNLQGITVRHSLPNLGSKIRNSTPIRPRLGTTVRPANPMVPMNSPMRPSNQLVPVRPRSNVARLSNPRMTATQRVRPSTSSPINSNSGMILKVSPDAIISPIKKRPNSDEPTGPFSCFKKPKESLIPVSDIPTISNSGESRAEYAASHISKSNFTSTIKTVKGGSVVTSTQTKSEISSSSQQLSKLNSMSGLRVVKTSQNNQAQVPEPCEVSTSNRSTLEAIQKLQKQGLLVKKPRIDVSENSEHLDPGGDDNAGYSSAEDNDDY